LKKRRGTSLPGCVLYERSRGEGIGLSHPTSSVGLRGLKVGAGDVPRPVPENRWGGPAGSVGEGEAPRKGRRAVGAPKGLARGYPAW
jgi:hypothetical protein